MEKVGFAVIGVGHIGKRHAEMVRRNLAARLVAVSDVRSREECSFSGTEPFYISIDEMLATHHSDIDVVCICTPNGLHAEHALQALKAGKHVVIEKPMALNKSDCESIIFQALQRSRKVFCVMQNRYSPPSVWIKEVVDAGVLGEIYMVQLNCFWNRDDRYYQGVPWKGSKELDGGVLFTQFSHFIDILYWLFGDISNIHSVFRNFRHTHNTAFEDSGVVTFDILNGSLGTMTFSTATDRLNYESSLTIIAEKGTIKIGGQYMNEVVHCDIRDYKMPLLPEAGPANDYGTYKGSAANHHYVFDNVIETLNGESQITTNAMEGLKVVDIIERIYAAGDNPWRQGLV
jgi:predicted dehydrogenase